MKAGEKDNGNQRGPARFTLHVDSAPPWSGTISAPDLETSVGPVTKCHCILHPGKARFKGLLAVGSRQFVYITLYGAVTGP